MCSGAALTLDRDDWSESSTGTSAGGGVSPCPISYPPAWAFIGRLLASFCGVEQSGSSLGS